MIANFEAYTYDLTDFELSIIPNVINSFKLNHTGKDKSITGKEIANSLNKKFNSKLNDIRIRKIVNYLRDERIPIIATSKGYYFTENKEEILLQIESLKARRIKIERAETGLKNYLKN